MADTARPLDTEHSPEFFSNNFNTMGTYRGEEEYICICVCVQYGGVREGSLMTKHCIFLCQFVKQKKVASRNFEKSR